MVYLRLPEPMVIVMAMPSCGGRICDAQILNDMQGTIGQAYASDGVAEGGAAENGKGCLPAMNTQPAEPSSVGSGVNLFPSSFRLRQAKLTWPTLQLRMFTLP